MATVACPRPIGRGDLHDKPGTGLIPSEHSLGVAPGTRATSPTSFHFRVEIELVVPEHEEKVAVVHLIEGSSDRILHCIAQANRTLLQCGFLLRGKNKLLAET